MSKIWIPGGGGGVDLDVVTAGAGDVLSGKVIVDKDGNPLAGTMPNKSGTALTVATNGQTLIPQGYHDGTQYAKNTQATLAGGTLTPSTSQVTVACRGKLMTSDFVIPGFSLPPAEALKNGYSYWLYGKNVIGSWPGYDNYQLDLFQYGTNLLNKESAHNVTWNEENGGFYPTNYNEVMSIWTSTGYTLMGHDYIHIRSAYNRYVSSGGSVRVYIAKGDGSNILLGDLSITSPTDAAHQDVYIWRDNIPFSTVKLWGGLFFEFRKCECFGIWLGK